MKIINPLCSVINLARGVIVLTFCFTASAEQAKKVRRIGYLGDGSAGSRASITLDPFREDNPGSCARARESSDQVRLVKGKAVAILLALSAILFALCSSAEAQQPKKFHRIGVLAPARAAVAEHLEAFRQGLHELGYIEGETIAIEYRYAEGQFDQLPALAAELVRLKVDLIVAAGGIQVIGPAKNATSTIPIVMTGTNDPVASGLVASLARPAGNITGVTLGGPELYGKRLELLKEAIPRVSDVAVFLNPTSPAEPMWLKDMQASAQALGLRIQSFEVRRPNDFEGAFQAATKWRARGLTVAGDPVFTANRKQILEFVANNRLPGIYPWREYVEDGGLMSYSTRLSDLYHRAAVYVDKILKGAKPGDLPVEQPTKFELVINLKAARQIGLTIPQRVLLKADRVIK
jgi:putative ABC transport system substrate-binding protein